MSSSPSHKYVIRVKRGKGFSYAYQDSGKTLKNKQIKKWITSLVIPPAWTDVHIDLIKTNKIHAFGSDTKKRKQYIYNEKWRAAREKKKFDHVIEFAQSLPKMRAKTSKHLRERGLTKNKVLACMTRLIDSAYFRPGNKFYAKENKSYGLTTLRSKHLEVSGDTIEFEYVGKSGKKQHRIIEEEKLVKIVKKIDALPGYRIFKYIDQEENICKVSANELNVYIKSIMGEEFSAKDFRTWAGTYLASHLLDELEASLPPKTAQKKIVEVVDSVAEKLGNTRSVARANYIDPRVIEHYSKGRTLKNFIKEVEKEFKEDIPLSKKEIAVIKLLRSKI